MKRVLGGSGLTLLALLAACSDDAVPIEAAATQNPATVFINELHYDNASTDVGEAVEVAGPAGTSLARWSLVLYNGSGGAPYNTRTLTGAIPDQGGGYGAVALTYNTDGIQNGSPDGLALVNAAGTVVQFLSYEGTFTAVGGPANGLASTDVGVAETASTPVGFSVQLTGDGTTYQDFTWSAPKDDSFGAVNAGQTFGGGGGEPDPTPEPGPVPAACGDDATLISAVQGDGPTTPLAGQTVTVEGVVAGAFGGAFNGFFVQEEDADGNPATSEGVFVYNDPRLALTVSEVSAGDVVRVQGTAGEAFGQTQISLTASESVSVCDAVDATVTPTDVQLPVAAPSDLERFEGMLVRFPQELVIAEYFNYDRFGEIVLALPQEGQDRPYTPTSYAEPGSEAQREAAENLSHRILLDDGLGTQNPRVLRHPNGEPFSLSNRFRGGDTVTNTVGVLDYRFGVFRVQPTKRAKYAALNPRTAAPDEVGGSLKVASFNVLNYFTTFGSSSDRGADNQAEFERQQAKIVAALAAIDADIFGLIEIQNNGDTAVRSLVDALNDEVGTDTYSFIPTGTIGTDAIKVAFIYKPATVSPAGDFAVLDSSDDPRFIDTLNRPALIQTFDESATGGRVTVAVNHFKSKGSDCDDVGDPNTGDGQGNCNLTRTQAAAALADYLATDPTGSGNPDFLVIGDLNAYDEEDPIDTLKVGADDASGTGDDYTDLNEAFGGEFAYSYAFDGQFGYLDYALVNAALTPQVTGTTEWHINADEPDLLDYNLNFGRDPAFYAPDPYRSSDHDPVVVGLDLTVPDSQELLADLIDEVEALGRDGSLRRGDARALLAQLETAQRQLGRGQERQAETSLERFEAGVARLVNRGVLGAEEGQMLIEKSSVIRNRI